MITAPRFVKVEADSDGHAGRVGRVLRSFPSGRLLVQFGPEFRNLSPDVVKDISMNVHKSIIHGKCPINARWDYYDVEIRSESFIKVEDVDATLDLVRGLNETQEDIAAKLKKALGKFFHVSLVGRHSQNTETRVDL